MKEYFFIFLAVCGFVFLFSFSIYNLNTNITGLVIINTSEENISVINNSVIKIYYEKDVLQGIKDAKEIIENMKENNFSILYMNDSLTEAERVLRLVKFAEILRNDSSSKEKKKEAQEVLQFVEWQNISYADSMKYIDNIKERKNNAFVIYDSLTALEISLKGYENRGINVSNSWSLLNKASSAFYDEQYKDSEDYLNSIKEELKLQTFSYSVFKAVQKGFQTFIEVYWKKYWYIVIVIFVMTSVVFYFIYRRMLELFLRKKIYKMKIERETLLELIKKAQEDRFKKNIIPGIVYNARVKNYKEKLNEIEKDLPILEEKLHRILIPAGYLKIEGG